jgi:putative inorganic carbon (HCO3(-)) transporter
MRDLVLTLFIFGSIPVTFMRPHIGLYIWAWLGYMNPHRLTWDFAYNYPFVQLVAIVTLIGLFISREKKHFPWSSITFVWLIFVVWMTISTMHSLNPDNAFNEWLRSIKIQIMIMVTLLTINSPTRVIGMIGVPLLQ